MIGVNLTKMRSLVLFLLVVLPSSAATSVSTYFLLPEWVALEASYKYYERVVKSPSSTVRDLFMAEAAQNRHRINCFAEGVEALLGGAIVAIGIHGMCTQPNSKS